MRGGLEADLDTLPAVTERLWAANRDVERICSLLSETEVRPSQSQ